VNAGVLAGGLIGAIVFAPPAVQLGVLASRSVAPWLALFEHYLPQVAHGVALPIAYAGAFGVAAFAVLLIGTGVGAALALVLSPVLRRLPVRPGWRAARISILLGLLGAALVYADRRVGLPWPEATPPATSAWLEREKTLFRDVLSAHRYDTIVLPVQADDPSFDRVARSLMTRYLTMRAEERTGVSLPDPTLLARALGVRERRLDPNDAFKLASKLGARKLLAPKVRRSGATFSVQADLWIRDDGGWKQAGVGKLEKLAYGERLPPSVAFRESVDSLLDQLGIVATQAPQAVAATPGVEPLHDLRQLATLPSGSPAERALRLQILAALHERESLDAETLWERSLLALWRVPAQSELERVLEARAYLHLYRRPYALERIGTPGSAVGRALAAALNGNVPDLEHAAAQIEERGQRLIAEIELADLYDFYNLRKRLVERRKQVLEPAWTEPAVLGYRLSAPEWFRADVHERLASEIGKMVPVDFGWREMAGMWLRWLYMLDDPLHEHNLALAHAVEGSYAPIWERRRADWAAWKAADRPAEWDYYDLLFATNRQALLKSVYGTLHFQALPARAAAMIERLGPLFAGYPRLMYFEAWALDRLGRDARPGTQKRLFSRSSALALSAYHWEGGESHLATAVEHYIYERPYQKYLDEPPRWHRVQVPSERLQFERLRFGAREIEREIAAARRRLDYSDHNERPLRDLTRWLRRAGRIDEALSVVQANRHRFVGSLTRVELLAEAAETGRGGADALAIHRELLELDPDSWEARSRLARAQMEAGDPALAQKTYLAFPGFASTDGQNVVALANHAFEAAYYLYRRGDAEQARPLFVRATQPPTGSSSEMRSRETLAVLQDDLRTALRNAEQQVQRYGDSYAGMRQLLYLSLSGDRGQAEALFPEYANRFGNEAVWMAAFIMHRMQGLEGPALEAWLAKTAAQDTRRDYLTGALRERHAFMLAYTDRAPSDEALAHVRRVAQANNRSPFYPQLAEGYAAWRKRDYALAAQKLRGPHDDLYNISINRRQSLSEWLPQVVFSYARSGQPAEAAKLLAEHLANIGVDSDYLIAHALMDGSAGEHESAAASLRLAFHRLPFTATRSFLAGYTLLEACELLFTETGNDLYRALVEDFARRLQVDLPYSWAAAFEAKYARDLGARRLALAAASTLDPRSERIAHFPEAERAATRGAAARHRSVLGAALRAAVR
jgi:hypothetical protein